jgi:VIT1/CCC1 family predicted Fe2+/Mn2+ transporter
VKIFPCSVLFPRLQFRKGLPEVGKRIRPGQVREEQEVRDLPEVESREVADVFRKYGLPDPAIAPILAAFRANPRAWVEFMMRFELGLEAPDPAQALRSALTIAGAYIAGGLVPLAPYFIVQSTGAALGPSITLTAVALAIFGFVKGHFTGVSKVKGAWQTALVGGLAAGVAYFIAKIFA